MHWDSFLDDIAGWLDTRSLLTPAARWVLGVSGGPDSTLLLQAMREIGARRDLKWELHVAHLHHGLRGPDADADADFVRAMAERMGLPYHGERRDVAARVAELGGSTEEVARQERYDFLERVALRTGGEHVAVAHHADDDAETILHRICRGTGLRGLAGMRPVRPIRPESRILLVRPLLHLRRATIESLCEERGLETRTDATNAGSEFTRGRVRNVIMPMLRRQLNPNVTEAILRLAEQARWLGTYLEDAAARTFESLLVSEASRHIVLNTRALLSKQRVIQAEVVRRAITLVADGEQDVSFTHVENVLRLAGERSSGKELHLPGPVIVSKRYDRLEFHPPRVAQPAAELPSTFISCPGVTEMPWLGAALVAELAELEDGKIDELRRRKNPLEQWLDFDRVRPPLFVRGRREGDRFWPLGAPGSKTLGDFLGDIKVAPAERDRTGVLCDQNGPIWIMPLRIDERVKLRPTTRLALRLVLVPEGGGQAEPP